MCSRRLGEDPRVENELHSLVITRIEVHSDLFIIPAMQIDPEHPSGQHAFVQVQSIDSQYPEAAYRSRPRLKRTAGSYSTIRPLG